MNKKITFIAVFCALAGALYWVCTANPTEIPGKVMNIEHFAGEPTITSDNNVARVVELTAAIQSGDQIETQADSHLYAKLGTDHLILVEPSTGLELVNIGEDLDITLSDGIVFFNATPRLENNGTLEFYGGNARADVFSGSGLFSYNRETNQSHLMIMTGSGLLYTNDGQMRTISSGEVGIISTNADGSTSFDITKINEVVFSMEPVELIRITATLTPRYALYCCR